MSFGRGGFRQRLIPASSFDLRILRISSLAAAPPPPPLGGFRVLCLRVRGLGFGIEDSFNGEASSEVPKGHGKPHGKREVRLQRPINMQT